MTTRTGTSETTLRQDLRAAGLRTTAQRLAVLQLLRRSRLPLSHTEVVARLGDQGWDRATLYRNLMDLSRAGLARRTELGDRVWRFEAAGQARAHRHPHFVCRDCQSVSCLDDVNVVVEAARTAPAALRGEEIEVLLKGRCDRCRKDDG
jgi:Fur family transcriptional regulator, ferric uptake regulator